jgi:hypothetical protein
MILGGTCLYTFFHALLVENLKKFVNTDSIFIRLVHGHCILKMCNPDELLMLHSGNRDNIIQIMAFSFVCDNLGLLIFVFGLLFHSKWDRQLA